jgi:hypothetical protein
VVKHSTYHEFWKELGGSLNKFLEMLRIEIGFPLLDEVGGPDGKLLLLLLLILFNQGGRGRFLN